MSARPATRAAWLAALPGLWLPLLAAAAPPPGGPGGEPSAARVVAVGDVHGELDGFVAILREAGLIDARLRWSGGAATLVQTGDFLDRGPQVRPVMDLLMRLQEEAPAVGGRVVVLLGNHEALNLFADYTDVAGEVYTEFADRSSKARRKEGYRRYAEWIAQWPAVEAPGKDAWMAAHPPGKLEYRQALGPEGTYGRWLRRLPTAVTVGDTLFVHGGIDPQLAPTSTEELDAVTWGEIAAFDRLRQRAIDEGMVLPTQGRRQMIWAIARRLAVPEGEPGAVAAAGSEWLAELLSILDTGGSFAFRYDSPVWFRGFNEWSEEEGSVRVAELLAAFGVERIVVGHSVRKGKVERRFGARVLLIDTGMLARVYGGRPSALEIAGGRVTAIYEEGEREVLAEP